MLAATSNSVTETLGKLFALCIEDNDGIDDGEELDQSASPLPHGQPSAGSYAIWRGIRIRPCHDAPLQLTPDQIDHGCISDFQSMFEELGYTLDDGGIYEWFKSDWDMSGTPIFTDTEICDLVSQEDMSEIEDEEQDEEMEEEGCPVSHSDAAAMFEQCLSWLEYQQEATTYNTALLRQLHSLAAVKRVDCLKHYKILSKKITVQCSYSIYTQYMYNFIHVAVEFYMYHFFFPVLTFASWEEFQVC